MIKKRISLDLVYKDMKEMDVDFCDDEIQNTTKKQCKKYVHGKVGSFPLEYLMTFFIQTMSE